MTRNRILALCITFVVAAGILAASIKAPQSGAAPDNTAKSRTQSFTALVSNFVGMFGKTVNISSDGTKYPVKFIDSIPVETEIPEGERLPAVGDIETLLKLLKDRGVLYDASSQQNYKMRNGFDVMEEALSEMIDSEFTPTDGAMEPPPAALDADSGTGSYSQTNEQVTGVSEGDIVKTDGKYIFAMSQKDNRLRIIKADGADLKVVSAIIPEGIWGAEFYLIGEDRLAIVGSGQVPFEIPTTRIDDDKTPEVEFAPEPDSYRWYSDAFTVLLIYDISDRAAPQELRRVSMEGWNISTRVIGGIVYLVTNKQVWYMPYDQADSRFILPFCIDSADSGELRPVSLDRIYYIPDTDDSSYMLIGAVDVYGDEPFEPEAYLGAGSNLYMNKNALYVTKWRWEQPEAANDAMIDRWPPGNQKTDILRFAINGTRITYAGMGTVDGEPINQYSMDEFGGYFRIATTDWNAGTFVTVLNVSDMRTVGRTKPLAPGEQMRSMRFMGDMGYIVTFQNVDPLFTVDLSDPFFPAVMGELKIPGFSQYLHPVGEGLLLGIGRDTQEIYTRDSNGVETVVGFRDVGMKASLFDVSDPFDPREVAVLALGEGWAEVGYNPRALMCDPSRGLYGFTVENWNNVYGAGTYALLLQVKDGRLSIGATISPDTYRYTTYGSRLCFIGNTLYLADDSGVIAYDYNSFEKLGGIVF